MAELEEIFALDSSAGRVRRAGAKVITPDCEKKIPSGSTVPQVASISIYVTDPSPLDLASSIYSHY
jgi:hypothetical protein